MAIETKRNGRELMVKFTCRRCKKVECLPYDEVMTGDHYGYLHNSSLPDKWTTLHGLPMCEFCTGAFKVFMEAKEEE